MTVAQLADLTIIVTSIINTGILIFLLVIVFSTYCRVKVILDSVAQATSALKDAAAVINRVIQSVDFISKIINKIGGGKEQ